jgi:hypothetical protein
VFAKQKKKGKTANFLFLAMIANVLLPPCKGLTKIIRCGKNEINELHNLFFDVKRMGKYILQHVETSSRHDNIYSI